MSKDLWEREKKLITVKTPCIEMQIFIVPHKHPAFRASTRVEIETESKDFNQT